MKISIPEILKALGWPAALNVIFAGILLLFGIDLDSVIKVLAGMVGLQLCFGVLIDILKWAGAIAEGYAGYVSALLNSACVVAVAVTMKLVPAFDFGSLDAILLQVGYIATLAFALVVQMVGTKQVHSAVRLGLNTPAFSYT